MRWSLVARVLLGGAWLALGLLGSGFAGEADAGGKSTDELKSKLKKLGAAKKAKILQIMEKNKDAIIVVEFVINLTVQGQSREQKIRLNGTAINEAGLAIVSNSMTDVAATMRRRLGARGAQLAIESSVLDVKIILNDGTEIPAKIALKDDDLDLMFVRPKKKKEGRKFTFITLDKECKPGMLDSVLTIARMDMSTNRAPLVNAGMVRGIIKKPRTYYVVNPVGLGLPAFDKNGRCFGLYLRRKGRGGVPMGRALVLPAEDILEIVAQVPAEKPTE